MEVGIAVESQHAELTALAFAAKAHWGYPTQWMESWRPQITITADYIRTNFVFVVKVDNEIAGFCGLRRECSTGHLDHLWIRPSKMGQGLGAALFRAAEAHSRAEGLALISIIADPHAEGFYRKMGAVTLGYESADMEGVARKLPLMQKQLKSGSRSANVSSREKGAYLVVNVHSASRGV